MLGAELDNPTADRFRQHVRVTVPAIEESQFAVLRVTGELHETVSSGSSYLQTGIGHRALPVLALEQIGNQL
jgi:hypothetical protein